jgi:transposase
MAAAYSTDIRQEGTQRELAARFKVSLSFISEFFRQYRETGKIEPKTLRFKT